MKQRVITAIVLLCVLAIVVWQIYTPAFIFVIAFLSAVAANEIMKCAKLKNKFILCVGTAVAGLIPFESSASILEPWVSADVWGRVINAIPDMVDITVIVLVFFLAMLKDYANTKFEDVAIATVASVAVPYAFSMFGILRDMFGFETQLGIYLIFYGLICALGTDVGAQLGGMAFGKHKMSPNISPKKTVEGAVCGVIFSFILNGSAMAIYNKVAAQPVPAEYIAVLLGFAPIVSFMGMMGDLTASVLKRNFGIKDFGKIFPGHGGVMDRFDSTLFTIPLTYCIATFVNSFAK
ncbi:MAG: phosphatidate cytidylyltransferase [Eubacterium sp.]